MEVVIRAGVQGGQVFQAHADLSVSHESRNRLLTAILMHRLHTLDIALQFSRAISLWNEHAQSESLRLPKSRAI